MLCPCHSESRRKVGRLYGHAFERQLESKSGPGATLARVSGKRDRDALSRFFLIRCGCAPATLEQALLKARRLYIRLGTSRFRPPPARRRCAAHRRRDRRADRLGVAAALLHLRVAARPERVARRRRRDGAGGPAPPPRGGERPGAHPRGHTDPTRLAGATAERRRVGVFPIDLGVYTCCWIPSVSINAIGLFFVRWAAGNSIARRP